ncbi:hypothetical protein Rcae01_00043 [Novipirellula caenicola]|uniref:Uncharacterized protein n=1 Tax=Novipirellula caenicola TaxID=1536901 RepID=A0ABP9VHA5_9BACT
MRLNTKVRATGPLDTTARALPGCPLSKVVIDKQTDHPPRTLQHPREKSRDVEFHSDPTSRFPDGDPAALPEVLGRSHVGPTAAGMKLISFRLGAKHRAMIQKFRFWKGERIGMAAAENGGCDSATRRISRANGD